LIRVLDSQGPIFATACIAATQAAKSTASLIPFCHQLPVTACNVDLRLDDDMGCIRIQADVKTTFGTGVEMEALTAASVAGLTIIDMMKAWSPLLAIEDVHLHLKRGGKRGEFIREEDIDNANDSDDGDEEGLGR